MADKMAMSRESGKLLLPLIGGLLLLAGQSQCPSEDMDADGWTSTDGDCNDNDASIHPGAAELCDSLDNDCTGSADDTFVCSCPAADYAGHTYRFCAMDTSWNDAQSACAAAGMNLATVNDSGEDSFLQGTAVSYDGSGYGWWCGYHDQEVEGNFVWVSGEASSYTNWDGGEPNDSGGEDCTSFLHWDIYVYRWNDLPCTTTIPYVCE